MKVLTFVAAMVGALALVPASLALGESKHSFPFIRLIQVHHSFLLSGDQKNQFPFTHQLP
jgi:hypothetical protein